MPRKKKTLKKQQVTVNVFAPTHPHLNQQKILDALDQGNRWVLLRAGRKFRKTSLMISWLFEQALRTHLACPFIAPNKVQAKNIVWDDHIQRMLNHFKEIGFPYKTNEVELSVEFPATGGKVQLFGVENADSLRGISNWGAIACDEYDDWEEDIWPLVIRPNLITHHAPAIIGGTPDGYKNLYRLEFPDNGSASIFKCFHFTSYDNPELSREELDALVLEYKSMGEGAFRQEILAQYERPEGTVYDDWSNDHYREFDYDPFLPVHVSFDFGVNDPTAIIWIQPDGGEFRVIDYYESSDADIDHFVSVIRSKPYRRPELYTGDAAGKARSITTNTSPIDEYMKHGIAIRVKDGLKIPDQIRITHKYIPMLYLHKSKSERLKECLLNYRYPKKSENLANQSNEIPIHDKWSHGSRALEYYFANIDGGGMFQDNSQTVAHNKKMHKKWEIK
jgi:hypothetical protein